MPWTIKPQTIMLSTGIRLEFVEEKHHGERSNPVLFVRDGRAMSRIRFDAQGDVVLVSHIANRTDEAAGEPFDGTTPIDPLTGRAEAGTEGAVGDAHAANG